MCVCVCVCVCVRVRCEIVGFGVGNGICGGGGDDGGGALKKCGRFRIVSGGRAADNMLGSVGCTRLLGYFDNGYIVTNKLLIVIFPAVT